MLRTTTLIAIASLAGAIIARPAFGQQDTDHHGGTLQAVGNAVAATGRAAKAGVKGAGSSVHHVLKTTGRSAKADLAHAVGAKKQDPNHKPGGLNKVVRDASESIKHVGRSAKAGVHEEAHDAHKSLQKTGNNVKKSAGDKDAGHSL
ncbi:MAG TPA: hypothetical protein VII66_08420 [Gemmatimonadaceae bacterium]